MKHRFLLIYTWFIQSLMFFLPDMPSIMRLRGWLYGLGMNQCGNDFQVTHDARLTGLQWISVGNHVFIGNHSMVFANGSIVIEDEVMVGPLCMLSGGNHISKDGSYRFGVSEKGDILLCKGSWVAANCTIVSGAILPEGSVLGANSMLNKPFDKRESLYGGVPAMHIKSLTI